MAGQAVALRWWSEAKLQELACAIAPAWQSFLDDWGLEIDRALLCRPAQALPQRMTAGWTAFAAHGQRGAWLHDVASARAQLATRLFGTPSPAAGSIAQETADACWAAAIDALQRSLKLAPAPDDRSPPGDLFSAWSGAACLELPCGGKSIAVLLNAPSAASLVSPADAPAHGRTPPTILPLLPAIADRSLKLKVELHPFELSLGDLQDLQVGDIVPLQHPLDRPLQVFLADGTRLCDGYLGQRAGRKAIEMVDSRHKHEVKLKV